MLAGAESSILGQHENHLRPFEERSALREENLLRFPRGDPDDHQAEERATSPNMISSGFLVIPAVRARFQPANDRVHG